MQSPGFVDFQNLHQNSILFTRCCYKQMDLCQLSVEKALFRLSNKLNQYWIDLDLKTYSTHPTAIYVTIQPVR